MGNKQKFKEKDLVIIRRDNCKTPKWILDNIRITNPRRIALCSYSPTRQHTLYTLGHNGRGKDLSVYDFVSSQLMLWENRGSLGRPREKRKYQKRGV